MFNRSTTTKNTTTIDYFNTNYYSVIWGGGRLLPIFFLLLSACQKKETKLFTEKPANTCGIQFINSIQEDEKHNMIDYSYVYNGGGVGAANLDQDSLPDLIFTGNQVPCAVYRNLGGLKFEDITAQSGIQTTGWCTGVTFADINADGLLDIYICRSGNFPAEQRTNLCYINQGNLHLKEQAAELGLADSGWSTQAAFFDYDRDGDLDCYVMNATNNDRYPNRIKNDRKLDGSDPASDHLYRNDKGHFSDVSKISGIGDDAWGLGLGIGDFNNDLWPDIYIGNDFLGNDLLYINQKDGTFANTATTLLGHTSHFSMGCDIADFNDDGLMDVFVADMMPSTNLQRKKMTGVLSAQAFGMMIVAGYQPQYMRNTLQMNTLQGFSEIGQMAGVHATDWTWSPLFADFDLDGRQDLSMTTGYLHDIIDMDFILQNNELGKKSTNLKEVDKIIKDRAAKQKGYASPIRFFKNNSDLQFADVTSDWSSAAPGYHNGSTVTDLDGDGDLDLVSNNLNAAPSFLVNNTIQTQNKAQNQPNWIKLTSTSTFFNGARVEIKVNNTAQYRQVTFTHGYQSAGDGLLYFGLADAKQVDTIKVFWPDGATDIWTNIPANQTFAVKKSETTHPNAVYSPFIQSNDANKPFYLTNWKHLETPYNDFDIEPLLPHQFSREGPGIAIGDMNADGLEDFFVTGATGQQGCFFIQKADGTYVEKLLNEPLPKLEEDVAAALADVDGDNDQDLIIVSGGIELEPNGTKYSPRLLLNNGKGDFEPTLGRLPVSNQPGSCIAIADYDTDGDLDLLIGGRRTCLKYGIAGNSMLLQNDGKGQFKDVSESVAPGLKSAGMVTDACWEDWNKDGQMDFLVSGEWMPLKVFIQNKGNFTMSEIPKSAGFWYSIQSADIDNDGDMDFVAGNMGMNNKYGISEQTPLTVYAKDFDGNGYMDPIIGYYLQNQLVTVHGRDELMRQLPKLRKTFSTYSDYAKAILYEVFSEKEMATATQVYASTTLSAVFLNDGAGQFSMLPLPISAQIAPMRDMSLVDLNNDGKLDIVAVGNDFTWEPGSGRMDASKGWIFFGTGNGSFVPLPESNAAFRVIGDARRLFALKNKKRQWVIARNNEKILIYNF